MTVLEDKHDEEMDMLMAILELAKSVNKADGKADEVTQKCHIDLDRSETISNISHISLS
jgi:hypothetical protein